MLHTTELERTSLEAHVDLCAIRYEALDNRLESVESKLELLHTDFKNSNSELIRVIIASAGTIVASCLSVVVVLLIG